MRRRDRWRRAAPGAADSAADQAEDDGLPRGGKVTSTWQKISGPGDATFSDASAGLTRVKVTAPGAYVLEQSATDGEKSNSLKVNVTVS